MKNLVDFDYVNIKDKELTNLFLSSNNIKKYILGINKYTRSIIKYIKIDGIIDDFTRVQSSRKKSILKLENINKSDSIILCAVTGSPLEVHNRLNSMGYRNINYLAFYKYSSLDILKPPFICDFENDFLLNKDRYNYTYNLLSDKKSQMIFNKIINFKITFDFKFMKGFVNNHKDQYFDKDIIKNKISNIVFFDGGGYIGDTSLEVIKNYPDFKKIYLVEPIAKNIEIAKRNLLNYSNIDFFNIGISDQKMILNSYEDKSFSNIYGLDDGDLIEINTIDNILKNQKIDFIKLDIEGAELNAINGAIETIKNYNPILAICIYHQASHWYSVPKAVLKINPSYKVYVRHYMEGIYETVMYFIP